MNTITQKLLPKHVESIVTTELLGNLLCCSVNVTPFRYFFTVLGVNEYLSASCFCVCLCSTYSKRGFDLSSLKYFLLSNTRLQFLHLYLWIFLCFIYLFTILNLHFGHSFYHFCYLRVIVLSAQIIRHF